MEDGASIGRLRALRGALRGAVRDHAGPFAVLLALATFLCAPILGDPTGRALGHPSNDVWNHVWGFWWVATELAAGRLPVTTNLLAWPAGGSLWFIDTFNVIATLPVAFLAGPVAAYNAAIFGNFVLCGVGAYVLALRVARSRAGATLAGVAFMSCPHLLGQAYNGISETLSAGWLPLALAAFLAAREAPRAGRAALAGAAFGVCAFANWYYGLFAAMVIGAVLAWDLVGAVRGRSPREWRLGDTRRAVLSLAIAGGVAALVAGGPFTLFYLSMGAADAVVTRDRAFVWMTLVMHNMTDLVSLVRPGKHYSPDLKAQFDEDLLVIVYLGHALVWPALATVWGGWRRFARPWALFAGAFVLLTLGPFLYVAGAYVEVGGQWIPLPFLTLFDAFPLFSRISHAYRFVVGASLALAVMLAWVVRDLGQRGIPVVAAAAWLGAMRLVEALWLSPAVFPLPTADTRVPEVYATLDGGAVLDLPVSLPVLARSRYGMYQIVHGQPVPYGLNDPSPLYLYVNRYTRYLIELERSTIAVLPVEMPMLDLALGQQDLRDRGLRWIVLHRAEYPAAQYAKVAQLLDLTATPTWDDGTTRVYRIGP
ncbi:MAG: hypothetical protein Q8P41_08585 [Pseudomonadota bacterium]|nr:hypothetical protein [Pseudomonadota bacterium]